MSSVTLPKLPPLSPVDDYFIHSGFPVYKPMTKLWTPSPFVEFRGFCKKDAEVNMICRYITPGDGVLEFRGERGMSDPDLVKPISKKVTDQMSKLMISLRT